MNNELKKLAVQAGAPAEVLDELWFSIFCMQFADVIPNQRRARSAQDQSQDT
jgi:hypothetical protein